MERSSSYFRCYYILLFSFRVPFATGLQKEYCSPINVIAYVPRKNEKSLILRNIKKFINVKVIYVRKLLNLLVTGFREYEHFSSFIIYIILSLQQIENL